MKKSNRRIRRTVKLFTFVLTLILLMSSMPLTFQAMAIETDVNIEEVEEYREEYSKHFKMPDGTYKAVSYTAPVHRMDENGEWQDLENILSENTVKNKQAYVTADGRTVFSKKISADDNTVFEINDGGYSMKVSFENENIKNSNAKLSNHAKKYQPTNTDDIETQYKKLKEIDTNTTVKYKNIIKNIDLEYVLSANDIKENIIIRKACDDYEFSFIYELEGLSATLCENGSVAIFDSETNEVKYNIPAPYMYDDDGVESTDVTYSLEDLGEGRYRLTVTPDETWINAEDRAFPVTVDPTILTVYDTYISLSNPNLNYDESENLLLSDGSIVFIDIGNASNAGPQLPVLPDDATITYSNMYVYYYYNISTGYMKVGLYQAEFDWQEATLTWNIASEYPNLGISTTLIDSSYAYADTDITASSPEIMVFDVTELMKHWYIGGYNYGIALRRIEGTNYSVIIKSMEAGESTRAHYDVAYSRGGIPFENGQYFFKNGELDKYLQIDDNVSVTTQDAKLELWTFDGALDQRWNIEYMHNGFYRILSVASGKAITAPSTIGDNITQSTYIASDNQLWAIQSTNNGMYSISPASTFSMYHMSAGSGIIIENGRNVELIEYQDDNDKDEWFIRPIAYAYSVGGEFFNGNDVIDAAENWTECEYISLYDINPTIRSLSYSCLNSEVVYFSSHGSQHRIRLLNDIYLSNIFATYEPNAVIINNYSLPVAKLYIYDACLTASDSDGTGHNLCTETIAAGVDCVIGWTEETNFLDARAWQQRFQGKIVEGESVINAANYANTFLYINNSTIKSWLIYGDSNLIINRNVVTNVATTNSEATEKLKNVDVTYVKHNKEAIKTVLSNYFSNFSSNDAVVTVTYTNISKTNYVIDYCYLYNGFLTSSGYSVIVENGKIIQMRDNTITRLTNINLTRSEVIPNVTDEIIEVATEQATSELNAINSKYIVTELVGNKYYDIESGKYYYRTIVTYMTPEETYGSFCSFYEL